ncbi:MAG TPA: PEP-CTERM sorting domain-containing protein [Verrucomicrobiae bacterium]|nr:PEP-CTERM sorting domain-containing protein [Verrucomicrobiae bacterium]
MKKRVVLLLAISAMLATIAWSDPIVGFQSYTPILSGGTVANFEGFSEFTVITNQYAGMTFSQTGGGAPWIDNYGQNAGGGGCSGAAWCYGYGAASGSGVLTGSTQGGNVVTTAGIIVNFTTPQSNVQAFLSDTAPLGNYTITAYGAGNTVLDTVTVLESAVTPPTYTGGVDPAPGTFPLPGIYVGFEDALPNIVSLQIGPSTAGAGTDAFAVDNVSFGGTNVPEPTSIALLGGVLVLVARRLRRKDKQV